MKNVTSALSNDECRIRDEVVSAFPPLPSIIRYFDEFNESHRTVSGLGDLDNFKLYHGGRTIKVRFSAYSPSVVIVLKHAMVSLFTRDVNTRHVASRVASAKKYLPAELSSLILSSPESISRIWMMHLAQPRLKSSMPLGKEILRVLCNHRVNGWSPVYGEFISKSLALPDHDKYAYLRSGKGFLSVDQEATVVRHIDESVMSISDAPSGWSYLDLASLAMLICAFQFGMRPSQIARLKLEGVRCRVLASDGSSAVHLAFPMAKQRRGTASVPLIRKVKPEWNRVFIELTERAEKRLPNSASRIFNVASVPDAGRQIAALAQAILKCEDVTAKTFRHSAAQRMVDAGASHEELAAFLGHTDITSGLVYFKSSPNHAARINRAFGISEIYTTLARVAHDRFINEEELAKLKGDYQVGAVPHGLPIAGIGGCTSGQPACPYNPVLSCYGCRRFMPLKDPGIHRRVLSDLRTVVGLFGSSAREEQSTPAFLQLQRTIANVQSIVGELEGEWHE